MRSRLLRLTLLCLLSAVAACAKSDGPPAGGGKKTCDDVGKNGLRLTGQVGHEGWSKACQEFKFSQADIDCAANAVDKKAFDDCMEKAVTPR